MKKLPLYVAFILLKFVSAIVDYDNYTLYTLYPRNDKQIASLRRLALDDNDLSFLNGVTSTFSQVDVLVPPHKKEYFQQLIQNCNLYSAKTILNVQSFLTTTSRGAPLGSKFDWNNYHRLEDIYSWLHELQQKYPNNVIIITIGKSAEGREIKGVKVTFKVRNKGIFLEGGTHGREWISPATVTYILNQILTNQDPKIRHIVESYNWYIVPVSNPDGYEYSHTDDRLWRKSRGRHGGCIGVDLNRNWDYDWKPLRKSCAQYNGPHAFSEPEVRHLSNYIKSVEDLLVFISFHSFGQYLMIPFAHNREALNHNDLMQIGKKAVKSLEKFYGTKYRVDSVYKILGNIPGSIMDWIKEYTNIPLVYTYELRDTGQYRFLLPREQIIPTGQETFGSIVTLAEEAKKIKDDY